MQFDGTRQVVVIHALRPSSRQTTIDHIGSFRDFLDNDVTFLHYSQPIPSRLIEHGVDVLIFNYDFLNYRFSPIWKMIKNRHRELIHAANYKVAIVQDDFWASTLIDEWILENGIDRVLTPIENDLDVLYPKSISKASFETVLTGYSATNSEPFSELPPLTQRSIDLGTRVRTMPPSLGRYAQDKARLSIDFAKIVKSAGFNTDVSARVEDTFLGGAWHDFLLRCRFVIGVKGGASLVDYDGSLHRKVQHYLARNPGASFVEVEESCFPNRDGKNVFKAVSPRLFDAARAGCCQILIEDEYPGDLQPWVDYLPIAEDLSNADVVLDAMKDLNACQKVAQNCHEKLIGSNSFTYGNLVNAALKEYAPLRTNGISPNGSVYESPEDPAFVFNKHGEEIHDFVYAFLHDFVMTEPKRKLKQFRESIVVLDGVNTGNDFSGFYSKSRPQTVTNEFVKVILQYQLAKWLLSRIDEYLNNKWDTSQVWIWRPFPMNQNRNDPFDLFSK